MKRVKRIGSLIFAFAIIFTFLFQFGCNNIKTVDGVQFIISEDKTYYIAVGARDKLCNEIKIASIVDDLPVKEIQAGAFKDYVNLTTVVISENVEIIENRAFEGCKKLISVVFPKVNYIIESRAFWNCGFERIIIDKNAVKIDSGAFSLNYNLKEFIVDADNQNYMALDGDLYSKDGTTFLFYAMAKSIGQDAVESFTINEKVNKILPYAFYDDEGNMSLKSIYLAGARGWKLNGENAQALVNNSFQVAGILRYTYAEGEWTR